MRHEIPRDLPDTPAATRREVENVAFNALRLAGLKPDRSLMVMFDLTSIIPHQTSAGATKWHVPPDFAEKARRRCPAAFYPEKTA